MALSLSNHRDAGTVTVSASGDIDLSTGEALEREITVAVLGETSTVLVDLAGVTFIDSAGINTLLKGRRLAEEHGRLFRVVNAAGMIRDLFDLTGVWGHLSGEFQGEGRGADGR